MRTRVKIILIRSVQQTVISFLDYCIFKWFTRIIDGIEALDVCCMRQGNCPLVHMSREFHYWAHTHTEDQRYRPLPNDAPKILPSLFHLPSKKEAMDRVQKVRYQQSISFLAKTNKNIHDHLAKWGGKHRWWTSCWKWNSCPDEQSSARCFPLFELSNLSQAQDI